MSKPKSLFIDKELTTYIRDWMSSKENRETYLPPPPENQPDNIRSRNFWKEDFDEIRYVGMDVDTIEEIDHIILDHYGLDRDTPLDDEFGYMVSWQSEGKEVTPHRDANRKGKINVRFNFMIQKPTKGGLPIISGKTLNVKENEVWLCLAGLNLHGTTKIEGKKDRIMISIGHYVDEKIVKEKGWMHPDCKPVEENPMWNRSSVFDEDKFYPYASKMQTQNLRNNTVVDVISDEELMEMVSEYYSREITEERKNELGIALGYIKPQIEEDEQHIS